jgi:outer membrane protein assembly factor BamB
MGSASTRAAAALVAALAVIAAGCDWGQVGYGPGHTSHNPTETVLTPDTVAGISPVWSRFEAPNDMSAPVAAGGRVFLTVGGDVVALDLVTGAVAWRRELYPDSDVFPVPQPGVPRAGLGDPAVADGRVYVPYRSAQPTCIEDLACTWELAGGVATFAADDGTPLVDTPWQTGVPSEAVVIGTAHGGYVIARAADFDGANFSPGSEVIVHRVRDGVRWTLASNILPALDERQEHLVTAIGATVRAHELGCAGPRCVRAWTYEAGGTVAGVATDGGSVYVTTTAGEVAVLDAASGAVRWTAAVTGPVSSAPAVAAGVVYVAGGDILSVVAPCGTPTCAPAWTAQAGGPLPVQPVVAGGLVYVSEATWYEPYPTQIPATRGLVYPTAGCGAATCEPVARTELTIGAPAPSLVADGTLVLAGDVAVRAFRLP